jgi:hypothetical protein
MEGGIFKTKGLLSQIVVEPCEKRRPGSLGAVEAGDTGVFSLWGVMTHKASQSC